MANTLIKMERVVSTMVGVLQRDLVLPNLVTRELGGDFKGAKDDTIKVKIPTTMKSRKRGLRSGDALVADGLAESTVDVKLTEHIYQIVELSLAELTLDVENFEAQVAAPPTRAVAEGIEDEMVYELENATYAVSGALSASDPWISLLGAGTALSKHRVPAGGRYLAVGADAYEAIVASDRISKVDQSGSDGALRDATIGKIAGFDRAVLVPGMAPKMAIAFHSTAFALAVKSPVVPQGAKAGAGRSFQGLSMTAIQDYNPAQAADQFAAHTFVGTNHVKDSGTINATTGIFTPDPAKAEAEILVRAIKLELP